MGFFHDVFSRSGRVARGQINKGVGQIEDATFESTVKQTVLDMRTELPTHPELMNAVGAK